MPCTFTYALALAAASLGSFNLKLTARQCTLSAQSSHPHMYTDHPSFLHIYHSHIPDDVRLPTHFQCRLEILPKADKKDLIAHPPASQLQSCDSTSAILVVLQHQVQEFDQAHSGDERLTKWLIPTVNVLYAFSAAVSEGVGMVPSPAKVIFAGIGVLL
ncbi:hypothetical protein EDB92DRAFT_266197 [Lactarius akahatsu]|uniref:Uncharacterized protein n=1 Tax=Lactarius akahatsu TaxID=416441 RepID=A0AAD4Q8I4_9AGAM|nr:hypothetical protein EDB92DRAFT_266197 [Lactarius akahatsu]